MPARKAAAKKPVTKATKPGVRKGAAKAPVAKKSAAKNVAPPRAPARRPPGAPPVEKTRVVIAMDFYEANKDAVKAPFKEHALKWNFLGEGKGLYKREDAGVHCFTQFKDDGVHYSIWGADKKACAKILSVWQALLGEEAWTKATSSGEQAVAAEKAAAESDAMRLWRLAEPQRRPGEPDLFFQKRVSEWQAKKPT